jgi:hypothetical protein
VGFALLSGATIEGRSDVSACRVRIDSRGLMPTKATPEWKLRALRWVPVVDVPAVGPSSVAITGSDRPASD